MSSYLVYHPKREKTTFGQISVYHANNRMHQDPYVWNSQFLHTYCHITQMSPQKEDKIFWVSGDRYPSFSCLCCDLVFVVQEKVYWENANFIGEESAIVDTPEAFVDHYQWGGREHYFKRRRRYTLKANSEASFQPQNQDGFLIDIMPFLVHENMSKDDIRNRLRSKVGSRPMVLSDQIANDLYKWLFDRASIKLFGVELEKLRLQHPELSSPVIKKSKGGCC